LDSSEVDDSDSAPRCHCVCTGSSINAKAPKVAVREKKTWQGLSAISALPYRLGAGVEFEARLA